MASSTRSYTSGKFALQLDGSEVGFVTSVEGGEAFGEVVDLPPGGKHIAGVGYAPIVLEVGPSIHPTLLKWVASMLDGTQKATAGAIHFLDYDLKERSRLEWRSALITEVEFPGGDRSTKQPVTLRVTIQPESTTTLVGSGVAYQGKLTGKNKAAPRSSFMFSVSGLELACKRVSQVAPLVVRLTDDPDTRQKGELVVADVVFWLAESDAAPFVAWFDDFVIMGINDAAHERGATLTFLDANSADEVMQIDFKRVGIHRVSNNRQDSSAEVVAKVKIEMYCGSVVLAPVAAVVEPTPAPAPAPVTAAVELLATALIAALQTGAVPAVTAEHAITERLLGSLAPPPPKDQRERGRAGGRKWAAEHARLEELEEIARLAKRDTWTALALAEGHTLVVFLAAAGDLDAGEIGPIELRRDDFTQGVVAGATEIYDSVADRLGEHANR